VSLSWLDLDGADGYVVFRDGARATADALPGSAYVAEGLQSGTPYAFAVAGVVAGGDALGATSAEVSATTSGPAPPLAAPTGLKVTGTTGTTVALAWDKAAGGVGGYVVLRDGAAVGAPASNSFTDADPALKTSTTYSYQVEATSSDGSAVSAPSAAITATTTDGYQCHDWNDNNYNHVQAKRATTTGGNCFCVGSGDNLGLYNVATYTTVAETAEGYFEKASCP
jgi:hypothetical protein